MASKLALVAFTGFTVAAVCIGAAAAIGARNMHTDGFDLSMFGGKPSCGRADGAGSSATRDIAWDGGDHATLSIPGEAHYRPGGSDMLHVSGDPRLVGHVRVEDGRIKLDCSNWGDGRLDITLPGRQFRKFGIAGSGKLVLEGLEQDALKVSIAGSGEVKGSGHVDRLEVHIAGSGDADLAQIEADSVKVHIAGSGDADIAPRNDADIHIAGSGDVTLHSNPAHMETHIAGSGNIRNAGGGI
jgi:hypothetical protein